ncbi:laminin subunit gamma-2 [Cheilinus undulatus]|uniref:laminin subunit gamma-2 n=1 Tax=Cheilinus undulatus TaxID=241271 RepID=UPI001BD68018|nr:laminin subunit gamma-2 [Cheilinus undulatus]
MKRSNCLVSLCGILAVLCTVQATYRPYMILKCDCNGRSRYCLRDAWGLHCLDCQGNTEGRHCERCKAGYYQEGAALRCTPCRCNATGSTNNICDSRGRCSCKEGISGDKCDRCPNGLIGPDGCKQSRQPRQDSGSSTLPCFCYGHSSTCSPQSGYSTHSITSTFATGPDDWTVAAVQGHTPNSVHFRWSPKHQDIEVISKHSLPMYLYAPAPYLGNQLLSYGQNLSFSLRLDRGVRHPSTSDVILEGSGLRVSASLGDLRSIVPCGQKIRYSFRLDEGPGSKWRPQISSQQFQKLLQNVTAIKIRATFGDNGRGYLDDVKLMSARRGEGVPARWVQTCSCPVGYEGDFCERCAAGFRRSAPADGAFSPCEPCSCRGGSCDPQTGDCYSADETPADVSCSAGFYRDPWSPRSCLKCPCPDGGSCSLPAGSLLPQCDLCPPGTTGSRCDVCQEGFYGNPTGNFGVQRPCKPCDCNGHIDISVAGSCDPISGECLKCLNNTRGRQCEECERGYYHGRVSDACKPCNCDIQSSESAQCDDLGRCPCKPGFEGLRCHRSNCPTCFSPIKVKMETYAAKLKDVESLFSDMKGGVKPSSDMEAALRAAEELVEDLEGDADLLEGLEKNLQKRLASISKSQLAEGQNIQNIADTADDIKEQQQTYKNKVGEVQSLISQMKSKLDQAKNDLRSADFPLGDAPLGSNLLSSLVKTATSLADTHQTKANAVEKTANDALSDSGKSLAQVQTLMNRENKVKGLIGDLKTKYDQTTAQVKSLENQAVQLSSNARAQSRNAEGMLRDISNMERAIPASLKGGVDAMVSKLGDLRNAVDIPGLEALQDQVLQDQTAAENLLNDGKAAQKDFDTLFGRVNVAKATTEDALKRINSNTNELDNALNALRGFDQQIDSNKAQANAAIKRLPGINGTIQGAVRNNLETLSALGDVTKSYNDALGTINVLENLVNGLEGTIGSLPPHSGLLNDAIKLNKDVKDLKVNTDGVVVDLASELDAARKLEDDAKQAAAGANAALNNAKQTNDAVKETLRDIGNMLVNMDQTGSSVDETELKRLEDSMGTAKRDVEDRLKPRLRDMEVKENSYKRRLVGINQDIDNILKDIANLEDILKTIPVGCYNIAPKEDA